ncbi:MAG: chaperone NapD [SAR324 cluster bacterium]|nr:chaperone NapD [SAR324 cluster bacterium]
MHISALYIACKPELQEQLTAKLSQLEWVDVQIQEPSKVIVTIEAVSEKEAEQKVKELETLHGVVAVQVSAYYCEETENSN